VRLNHPEINEISVFLVKPILNEIGLASIPLENDPAADIYTPVYMIGEEQGDCPRPIGYRNRRYKANQVRAFSINFSSEKYGPRTQKYSSWNKIWFMCKILEGIRLIDYVLPEFLCRLTGIVVEHRTLILVTREAMNSVNTRGLLAIGIEDTWPIKYVLP